VESAVIASAIFSLSLILIRKNLGDFKRVVAGSNGAL
jgi:hypothetical protein